MDPIVALLLGFLFGAVLGLPIGLLLREETRKR